MRDDIAAQLELNSPELFVSGFDRPNIRYAVETKTDPRRQLLGFLGNHRDESGIVYCLARKKTESIAEWLCGQGFDALPYHAGLSAETRSEHQRRFVNDDAVIIVATIAFGMGIDKPDVRFVAHLDLPKSIEAYYQETGRAGRDGEPADAWMTYGLQEMRYWGGVRSRNAAACRYCAISEKSKRLPAATATTVRRRPRHGTARRLPVNCCPPSIARARFSVRRTSSMC
jgi:RecQ family ATP-dependent DNA helicase